MKNTKNHIFSVRENLLICETFKENSTLKDSNMRLDVLYRTIYDGNSRNFATNFLFVRLARPNCCACLKFNFFEDFHQFFSKEIFIYCVYFREATTK